jgi:hypothetical protein
VKMGIIISLFIVAALAAALIFSVFGALNPSDERTLDSRDEVMVKQEMPAKAPPLFTPKNPDADAGAAYAKAFDFYAANEKGVFSRDALKDNPTPDEAGPLADLLIEAMDAGRFPRDLWDGQVPQMPAAFLDSSVPLQNVADIVANYAIAQYRKSDKARGNQAAKAVWAMGLRAFQENTRLRVRMVGLGILDATGPIFAFEEFATGIRVDEWLAPIADAKRLWLSKYEFVFAETPNVADVIRVAELDKDPTWRYEAILKLGSLKFYPGKPEHQTGNAKLIAQALERAKADPDPYIAQAAAAAEAITLEQHKRQN